MVLNLPNRNRGRQSLDFRKIFIQTEVINSAKGSAYLEQGRTKVMCAVFGPKEITSTGLNSLSNMKSAASRRKSQSIVKSNKGTLICRVALAPYCRKETNPIFASLSSNPMSLAPNDLDQNSYYSLCLHEALESTINLLQYPKSQIEICAFVLEDDGSLLSALINCSSLAIITSGIEVFDVLSSATMISYKQDETDCVYYLDPDKDEEIFFENQNTNVCTFTIGYLPALCQVTCNFHIGEVDTSTYTHYLSQTIITATVFSAELRKYLKTWATSKQNTKKSLPDYSDIIQTIKAEPL